VLRSRRVRIEIDACLPHCEACDPAKAVLNVQAFQ